MFSNKCLFYNYKVRGNYSIFSNKCLSYNYKVRGEWIRNEGGHDIWSPPPDVVIPDANPTEMTRFLKKLDRQPKMKHKP